jgi:hypothetical protein
MKKVLKALYSYLPFKRQLFLLLKNFWLPPPHIYQHLYFSGVFNVELANGISFKVDHFGQQIENELFWRGLEGGWEKESIRLWKKLCENA